MKKTKRIRKPRDLNPYLIELVEYKMSTFVKIGNCKFNLEAVIRLRDWLNRVVVWLKQKEGKR